MAATEIKTINVSVAGSFWRSRKGIVRLTAGQAKKWEKSLAKVEGKKDLYEVINAVQFDKGEVFGLDSKTAEQSLKGVILVEHPAKSANGAGNEPDGPGKS